MQYLLIVLVVVTALGLPVQDALNAQLRSAVKSPMLGACISLLVGSCLMGVAAALGILGRGHFRDLMATPWWVWAGGGLLGALAVVAALVAIPKSGAALVITATVLGQLLAALALDHFGWLGVPRTPINPWRIAGAVGLFVSALLMQHK